MEIGRAAGQPAQNRSFNLANMVEPAIDQGLAEIGGGFAVVGPPTLSCVRFAHRDLRQEAQIQASQVD